MMALLPGGALSLIAASSPAWGAEASHAPGRHVDGADDRIAESAGLRLRANPYPHLDHAQEFNRIVGAFLLGRGWAGLAMNDWWRLSAGFNTLY